MALVITQQPLTYMPMGNSQFFSATSTNTAQPNHTYTVVATDIASSESRTYQIPARPDGAMVFDAKSFAEQYISTVLTYLPSGWQKFPAVKKIRVNVGETYGSTPTYYAGSNIDYYVWNGIVDYLPFVTYAAENYYYDASVPYTNTFYGITSDITYSLRSSYLMVLNKFGGTALSSIRIRTFNSAGSILGVYKIDNPYATPANLSESYVSIDIGHKGLTGISAGLVTVVSGTYPIMTSSVASYEVSGVRGVNFDLIKNFTVNCEARYTVYTVHFLAKNGGFGTIHFNRISEFNLSKSEQTYKVNPNQLTSGAYGYAYETAVERQLTVETQAVMTLRTDWLTDEQVNFYEEILDSPICYLDTGTGRYQRIIPVTNSYNRLPHYENPLFMMTMQFKATHTNGRQIGQ